MTPPKATTDDQLQRRKRADEAPVLRLSCRGAGPQRADDRRGGEGDCPVRSLYPVQGLQDVPYRAGQGVQARPCRPAGPPERRAAEQGDALRHPDRPEAVLRLARRTARLQVPHLLFGCRILQPFGQGDADRQGDPPGARSDPGAEFGTSSRPCPRPPISSGGTAR